MIFCGDFVYPGKFHKSVFKNLGDEFLQAPKVINLESVPAEFALSKVQTAGIALNSSSDLLDSLNYLNVKCVSLANNHITDYAYSFSALREYFLENHISVVGAGDNISQASKPFIDEESRMIVLAYGWESIRCKRATSRSSGVNPLRPEIVSEDIKEHINTHPGYKIVLFLHWNYELEKHPFPADRKIARQFVQQGASAVIGHHPHLVGGYEIIDHCPVFYSLGNFFFPHTYYNNQYLSFPPSSLHGISIAFDGMLERSKIIHHKQLPSGEQISLTTIDHYSFPKKFQSLFDYGTITPSEYLSYYKRNREKRGKFLPIFKDYDKKILNYTFNKYVKIRQIPLDIMYKLKK